MPPPKLCRICAREQSEFVNMCTLYYGNIPAAKFIMDVLKIKIDNVKSKQTSALVICKSCNAILNNFYKFYDMVKEAQVRYTQVMCARAQPLKCIVVYPKKLKIDKEDFKKYTTVPQKEKNERESQSVVKCEPQEFKDISSSDDFELNAESFIKQESALGTLVDDIDKDADEIDSDVEMCRQQTQPFLRKKMATDVMLKRYSLNEVSDGKQWLLGEKQIEELLSLYVDMQCTECLNPPFNTYTQLEKHSIEEHKIRPTVICCRTSTTSLEELKCHILLRHIHKTRLVPCTICKKLMRDSVMKQHLYTHLPEDKKEFPCDQCDKRFRTCYSLKYHVDTVHSQLSVSCEDCGKTYKSKVSLMLHKRNVHSTSANNLCPDCGKTVKGRSNFEIHMKIHQGIQERVKCQICGIVVKKICMPSHMRSHNPKNIKQCPHCPYKGFRILGHIKIVHDKIKPFTCPSCPMTFYNTKTMKDHVAARHTGIPRYSCEFCSKTFMSSGNHHSHCKRMHPEQLEEKRLRIANEKNKVTVVKKKAKKKIVEGAEVELVMQDIQRRSKGLLEVVHINRRPVVLGATKPIEAQQSTSNNIKEEILGS